MRTPRRYRASFEAFEAFEAFEVGMDVGGGDGASISEQRSTLGASNAPPGVV
ncbi:hypothetical protein [Corynebacterium liangguodongii]|uniref:hypothetical protein n=1 Tax=Corynebacterium liangguodongii TaxID=2079535 RepID=UPI0013049374|nr:hypothetical protein [Corynebacterium liangguodongii]